MLRGYSKFLDVLEKIEKVILAVTVGIMVLIIAYQVIMRYIFAHANSWSEELARYLFIYDVMIGAAIAIRRNSHLQIDILINLMNPKVRTILTIIATLAGMVFMVFLLSYSPWCRPAPAPCPRVSGSPCPSPIPVCPSASC